MRAGIPLARKVGSWPLLVFVAGLITPTLVSPLIFPQAARAEAAADDERGYELYLLGERLYAAGRYEGAVEAFLQSYELTKRPLLLFDLANAHERLGQYPEAAAVLEQYLAVAPEEERTITEERITALRARAAAPTSAAPSAPALALEQDAEAESRRHRQRVLIWSGIGAGASLGLTGVLLVSLGEVDHRRVVDDKHKTADGRLTSEQLHALNDSGDRKKLAGYLLGGTGATLLAASGALFFLEKLKARNDAAALKARSLALRPLRGGGAVLTVSGSF